MRHFFLIITLIFSSFLFAQHGKVVKVKDGDTVVILDNSNQMLTIRVADIDCPERGQPFSNKAKLFVSKEIFGKNVFVKKKNMDRYNRIVGYVLYDNKNLSLELLRHGLAWHYSYFSNDATMAKLERNARNNKVGLWSEKNPIEPYLWRKNKRNN